MLPVTSIRSDLDLRPHHSYHIDYYTSRGAKSTDYLAIALLHAAVVSCSAPSTQNTSKNKEIGEWFEKSISSSLYQYPVSIFVTIESRVSIKILRD